MSNNTRVGDNARTELLNQKNNGYKNIRVIQCADGGVNIEGTREGANGQLERRSRRVYSPRHGAGSRAAYKAYRRIITEYNWFKFTNRAICGHSANRDDVPSNFIIGGLISFVIIMVMVVFYLANTSGY